MARPFDIIERLKQKNEKPILKITEDLVVTIDNSKTTVLSVEALMRSSNEEDSLLDNADKMLGMLIGSKNVKAINKLDLSMSAYQDLVSAIVSIAISGEMRFENL